MALEKLLGPSAAAGPRRDLVSLWPHLLQSPAQDSRAASGVSTPELVLVHLSENLELSTDLLPGPASRPCSCHSRSAQYRLFQAFIYQM